MIHNFDPILTGAKNAYRLLNKKRHEYIKEPTFKEKHSFEKRYKESELIIAKYPNRIPIIVERFNDSLPNIDRKKYLAPYDLSVGNFMYVVRKRIKITPEKSLFLFFNDKILPVNVLLGDAYNKYRDDDGYLYVKYCEETTFG